MPPKNAQYYGLEELKELVPKIDFKDVELLSTDSYSDSAVWDSINATGDVKTLAVCAIQTAVIGTGNRNLGALKYKGTEMSVEEVYKLRGVKLGLKLGSKIKPGDLTPRRIQRAFRMVVKDYLTSRPDISSFLWRKYSPQDKEYKDCCFPGAEHMVETKAEAQYLHNAYKELDKKQNTNIADRIERVLQARGIVISDV